MEIPQKWKDKSEEENIQIADILYGLAVENLFQQIEKSSFYEYLWLTNEQAIGISAYKKKRKERIEFLYVESGKKNYLPHAVAGQAFDQEVLLLLLEELFPQNQEPSNWSYVVFDSEDGKQISLCYSYLDMKISLALSIKTSAITTKKRKIKTLPLLLQEGKSCSYVCYSKESVLAEALFEIMQKLELIADMSAYGEANQILKEYPISGRYILEELSAMGEREKKVVSMRRLEHIAEYKNYTYMRNRWQQYERISGTEKEEWESVLTRILAFLGPIWKALCEDEIFFDDWMPELERFLG